MSHNTRWTSHITDVVHKKLFAEHIEESTAIFDRLRTLLYEKLDECRKSKRSLKSYAMQAYSEYQADRNATERTILELIELLPKKD